MCAADESCADLCLMVDEPLHVASSRWVHVAEAVLAVAQGVCIVPLVGVVRVSAGGSVGCCLVVLSES